MVTDEQMAGLRAFLAEDEAEWDRLFEGTEPVDADEGFALIVAAAFVTAARRRWGGAAPRAGIVGVVARMRSRDSEIADRIDPRDAERLLQAVLEDPAAARDLDPRAKGAQVPLLRQLVDELEFDDADLDEFLAQARSLADQMSHAH
jgi:hypothetical protein